jgi:drug/metabolite transporter (DMT)-like permease
VEIVFGGVSSLLYGAADFLGGEGARRAPAAAIVFWAGAISFPLILVVALLTGGEASTPDYLIGAAAGASGACGLVFLFAGLGRGRAASVAPVAAALAAVLPVVVAVVEGERPSPLAWMGVIVAVPAIVLCASVGESGGADRSSTLFGVVAGLGFGGFTALIRFTGEASNLLPLVASRASTILIVLILGGLGVWKLVRLGETPRPIVIGNAVLDVAGNVALLLAIRAGSLALAAVAASFYPAVTVMIARVVNSEHLRGRQVVGLTLTLIAMTTIAIG